MLAPRRRSYRVIVTTLLFGLVLTSCEQEQGTPAEEEVRALVEQAEGYVEEGDLEAFRKLISDDYADAHGNNRQSVSLLLNYYFSANRNIYLLTRTPQVHFRDSSHADILVFVAMAGRPIGGSDQLSALNADLYHVYASVADEEDEWRITSARWARGWEPETDAAGAGRILRDRR